MVVGLFLLYGRLLPAEQIETFLSVASLAILLAMLLMQALFVRRRAPAL